MEKRKITLFIEMSMLSTNQWRDYRFELGVEKIRWKRLTGQHSEKKLEK